MKKSDGGQILIIVAVLLTAAFLLLAVIIDGSRLLLEQQELNRAADAAGKAGLIMVGNQMVTQVVNAQTAASSNKTTPTNDDFGSELTLTPAPGQDDFFYWINDDHRKTLVGAPMQTLVATHVLGAAEENGLGLSNPSVTRLEIVYPFSYDLNDQFIRIKVRIERVVPILFGNFLQLEDGVLSGDAEDKIPQR